MNYNNKNYTQTHTHTHTQAHTHTQHTHTYTHTHTHIHTHTYALILNPLFNLEPIKGLEYLGDVRMFGSASNSTCKSILNMLKALNWSDG